MSVVSSPAGEPVGHDEVALGAGAAAAAARKTGAPALTGVVPALARLLAWCRRARSVRAQLLATFVAIGLVAALIAGGVTILQARKSTRLEIAASLRMAEVLVGETAELLRQQELPAEHFLATLPAQLRLVRHVRVTVSDASGMPVAGRAAADSPEARADGRVPAPAWFAALIAPPPAAREVPVMVKGQRIGSVRLAGEPGDEIAEVWENTVDFTIVALAVSLAVIAALYVLLGRVLDPLTGLAAGLADLEGRNYRVRLARPRAPELAAITDRFNALAEALDAVRAENARLHHRLITAQDDERRQTALDLHDEVGPSLFGLNANAASIANAAGDLTDPRIRERAREMLAVIEHLQGINRSLLNRLRPMALGHVPLAELVAQLVRERERQHPDVAFTFSTAQLRESYGDSIDLTVYRCVQEALTNVIRHAAATRVEIDLEQAEGSLRLLVRDDGRGLDPAVPAGRGLTGMQERVQALAGTCTIEAGARAPAGRGTLLRVAVPLPAPAHEGGERAGGGRP